jgi:hypothetical protein
MNLLYLGLITERVPVIPYFTPTHVGGNAPTLAFGDVFDLPRLQKAIGAPILEWHQVKVDPTHITDYTALILEILRRTRKVNRSTL